MGLHSRLRWKLKVVLGIATLLLGISRADIIVLDENIWYPSRVDQHLGQRLASDAVLPARLQRLPGGDQAAFCPNSPDNIGHLDFRVNATSDGLFVALLVPDGVCTLREKADYIMKHGKGGPIGALIVQDKATCRNSPMSAPDWSGFRRPRRLSTPTTHDDIEPFLPFVIALVPPSDYSALDRLAETSQLDGGGPRVRLNGQDGAFSCRSARRLLATSVVFWFLWMIVYFSWRYRASRASQGAAADDGSRRRRRRLTWEQVNVAVPEYRYDGLDDSQEEDCPCGDIGKCVICLEDFQQDELLGRLSCGHLFHSACIGKWLVERSAVCPLCNGGVIATDEANQAPFGDLSYGSMVARLIRGMTRNDTSNEGTDHDPQEPLLTHYPEELP